ncbi:conserved hypothetical protein [Tenacibaculum sp. 190524A05c]|uniref:HBL/NHE enterotoxin family protein n=1 Tax=Tenacibaculum platacis TaxID=3137852 RepID=UPI0031FB8CB7
MKLFKINSENIGSRQINVSSSGLVLQAFCNSALQQPDINLSSVEELIQLQEDINLALANSKKHANEYLNDINPRIIKSISDLKSYFTVFSSVPVTLPQDATVEEWVTTLLVLKGITENNLRNSEEIVTSLNELRDNLRSDASSFAELTQQANEAVNGDEGELQEISDELKEIDTAIKLLIASIVGESLAVAGGVIVIGIGAYTGSAEAVVGGVIAIGVGVTGLAASSIELSNQYDKKRELLQTKSKLEAEINVLSTVDGALGNIADQAETAAIATEDIIKTWEELSSNLDSLIDDLNNGIISTDDARTFFLNSANNEIVEIQNAINNIQLKLAGVVTITSEETFLENSFLKKVS